MDDIGNLVYILVFIVWFLSRLFGKGRKKPAAKPSTSEPNTQEYDSPQPSRPSESTPPPVTFEDILRELTGAPSTKPAPQPVPREDYPDRETYLDEPEEEERETSFEVLDTDYQSADPELMPDLGKLKVLGTRKQKTSQAARQAFNMMRTPQGARQAFLMKEIFDRKY